MHSAHTHNIHIYIYPQFYVCIYDILQLKLAHVNKRQLHAFGIRIPLDPLAAKSTYHFTSAEPGQFDFFHLSTPKLLKVEFPENQHAMNYWFWWSSCYQVQYFFDGFFKRFLAVQDTAKGWYTRWSLLQRPRHLSWKVSHESRKWPGNKTIFPGSYWIEIVP